MVNLYALNVVVVPEQILYSELKQATFLTTQTA